MPGRTNSDISGKKIYLQPGTQRFSTDKESKSMRSWFLKKSQNYKRKKKASKRKNEQTQMTA